MSQTQEFNERLAASIRAERARSGVGQEELAARMQGIGHAVWIRQTVSTVERGKRRVTVEELFGLARCLGIQVWTLLDGLD